MILKIFEEISNLCESSKDELEVDDFKDSTKKLIILLKIYIQKQIKNKKLNIIS